MIHGYRHGSVPFFNPAEAGRNCRLEPSSCSVSSHVTSKQGVSTVQAIPATAKTRCRVHSVQSPSSYPNCLGVALVTWCDGLLGSADWSSRTHTHRHTGVNQQKQEERTNERASERPRECESLPCTFTCEGCRKSVPWPRQKAAHTSRCRLADQHRSPPRLQKKGLGWFRAGLPLRRLSSEPCLAGTIFVRPS